MRKFKVISTCAALLLMVALMAFGVYAANIVTISVSGTVSFKCTDVYIKINYGLIVGDTVTNLGDYYSQPGDPVTWKESQDATNTVSLAALPELKFTEENISNTYYITVQNLHGMPIYFNFGYKWENSFENNLVTAVGTVYSGDHTSTTVSVANDLFTDGISGVTQVPENSTYTLKVVLTLNNTEHIAGGQITIASATALEQSGAEITNL